MDESIDYVFTDPPFGAYIPYAEINQLNELWLGKTTRIENEAIISPAQGKGVEEYRALLTLVFSEVARVLKPAAEATLVFHSSHATVWQALTGSLADAGLSVSEASILDKVQPSFKQVNGHVAVSGDPLLRVMKSQGKPNSPATATMQDLICAEGRSENGPQTDARKRQHRYSELIGAALVNGVPITMDARAVYQLGGD